MSTIIAAESVAIGHPDKVADQISDSILDAYLAKDPEARVDCTCVLGHDTLLLTGEITSHATVDVKKVATSVLERIGYNSKKTGFDAATCKTVVQITKQSNDIADALVATGLLGAGDQGIMVGYATDETAEYMPLPVVLAHKLMQALRYEGPQLGPDGKTVVGVRYDGIRPLLVEFIILSCQHVEEMPLEDVRKNLRVIVEKTIPQEFMTDKTKLLLNPGGKFVIGGPSADTGLTGRKLMVDTYGTSAHHGGGAFSGKDATKVDRSAAYMARYIAKNIVASTLARRAEVTLHYAIGMPYCLALSVETFGTSSISNHRLEEVIPKVFDLSVAGIISTLELQRPIFSKTSWGGHFGRNDAAFTWEATNKTQDLLSHF